MKDLSVRKLQKVRDQHGWLFYLLWKAEGEIFRISRFIGLWDGHYSLSTYLWCFMRGWSAKAEEECLLWLWFMWLVLA